MGMRVCTRACKRAWAWHGEPGLAGCRHLSGPTVSMCVFPPVQTVHGCGTPHTRFWWTERKMRFVMAEIHAHVVVDGQPGDWRSGRLCSWCSGNWRSGWDFDVAFATGVCIPACERVAAAVTCAKGEPVQRLARGSGARAFFWQPAAVDDAEPSMDPRRGAGDPDARARQGCAQVPAAAGRVEGVVLFMKSWMFSRFVTTGTRAHVVADGQPGGWRSG